MSLGGITRRRESRLVIPPEGCDLQWLADYLNQEPGDDPHDYGWLIGDFLEEQERDLPEGLDPVDDSYELAEYLDPLLRAQPALKRAWMEYVHRYGHEYRDEVPPYAVFLQAKVAKPGGWYWHFNHHGMLSKFERGATLDELGFTHDRNSRGNGERATRINCARNVSGELGRAETVFGFAVADDQYRERGLRAVAKQYGRYGMLFQTDCAVRAYHTGDEQEQAIFLTCSEYNMVGFSIADYDGTLWSAFGDMEEEQEFDTFESLLMAVEAYLAKDEAPTDARALNGCCAPRRRWVGRPPARLWRPR